MGFSSTTNSCSLGLDSPCSHSSTLKHNKSSLLTLIKPKKRRRVTFSEATPISHVAPMGYSKDFWFSVAEKRSRNKADHHLADYDLSVADYLDAFEDGQEQLKQELLVCEDYQRALVRGANLGHRALERFSHDNTKRQKKIRRIVRSVVRKSKKQEKTEPSRIDRSIRQLARYSKALSQNDRAWARGLGQVDMVAAQESLPLEFDGDDWLNISSVPSIWLKLALWLTRLSLQRRRQREAARVNVQLQGIYS